MPLLDDYYGYGKFTNDKFKRFDYFLDAYLGIVKRIQMKAIRQEWLDEWQTEPFHFIDMNCGPGKIYGAEPIIKDGTNGSPLIFLDNAEKKEINYKADFVDNHTEAINQLVGNIPSLNFGYVDWHCFDNKLISNRLISDDFNHKIIGLVYHDPNNGSISWDALKRISELRPKYDILINIPTSLFKRKPESYNGDKFLSDYLSELGKNKWLITDFWKGDKHCWTFAFLTNFISMKDIEAIGLRDITCNGRSTFKKANLTKNQIEAQKKSIQLTMNI